MDVPDLLRKQEKESKETALIFNPLKVDFSVNYGKVHYFIVSKEYKRFPKIIANHVGKHLVDAYLATKDKNYSVDKARKLVFDDRTSN